MQKNVGTFDALIRITCGLTGLAWGVSRMIRHPHRGLPVAVTMASAMKVAEGVTRYCPMLAMLQVKSNQSENNACGTAHSESRTAYKEDRSVYEHEPENQEEQYDTRTGFMGNNQ